MLAWSIALAGEAAYLPPPPETPVRTAFGSVPYRQIAALCARDPAIRQRGALWTMDVATGETIAAPAWADRSDVDAFVRVTRSWLCGSRIRVSIHVGSVELGAHEAESLCQAENVVLGRVEDTLVGQFVTDVLPVRGRDPLRIRLHDPVEHGAEEVFLVAYDRLGTMAAWDAPIRMLVVRNSEQHGTADLKRHVATFLQQRCR